MQSFNQLFTHGAWEVLSLFLIPIGGGIPAGVILAKNRGFAWPSMLILYFVSDVILACIFEPIVLLIVRLSRHSPRLAHVLSVFRQTTQKTIARYGLNPGPWTLIMIAFGVDPMTGRAAAMAAGHGFIVGWLFAIAGDLVFFTILMASTLWLNNVLGDGTWTAIIIMVAMVLIPKLISRLRRTHQTAPSPQETTGA